MDMTLASWAGDKLTAMSAWIGTKLNLPMCLECGRCRWLSPDFCSMACFDAYRHRILEERWRIPS